MDDGTKVGSGLKLCTNAFLSEDIKILSEALRDRYGFMSTIQSAGVENQYILYIWVHSMPALRDIVKPHIVKSMWYKIGC